MSRRLHCHICQKLRPIKQLEILDPWRNEKRGGRQLHQYICRFCADNQITINRIVAATEATDGETK